MQQVRITVKRARRPRRRDALLDALPADPRDPDIARAKALQRDSDTTDRRTR